MNNDQVVEAEDLLRDLLGEPPDAVVARLTRHVPPATFNWLGLAEAATNQALADDEDAAASLAWAQVAGIAWERLASQPGIPGAHQRFMTSLMLLRAALIARHSASFEDPLLDSEEVLDWFLVRRRGELDAAARDSSRWQELPVERILELREIKDELGVVELLSGCSRCQTPEVQRWLELRNELP